MTNVCACACVWCGDQLRDPIATADVPIIVRAKSALHTEHLRELDERLERKEERDAQTAAEQAIRKHVTDGMADAPANSAAQQLSPYVQTTSVSSSAVPVPAPSASASAAAGAPTSSAGGVVYRAALKANRKPTALDKREKQFLEERQNWPETLIATNAQSVPLPPETSATEAPAVVQRTAQ
jgi:hypothetical protein